MNNYKTNNFDIDYKKIKYKNNTSIEIELLRKHYYILLLNLFVEGCRYIGISDKKLEEIFFYFVINNQNDIDPIINIKYTFNIKFIENILKKNIKEDYEDKIKIIKNTLKKLKLDLKKYVTEFNKLIKNCDKCFDVVIDKKQELYIIKLKKICDDNFYIDVSNLSFSIHISLYKHLHNLYLIRNKQENNIDFHNKLFILYCRYNYLSSGSTQASIQPKFKKKLTELLNTKVELFASGINSSYMNYGSLFYDIEKYFGSLGSYFDMNLKSGYYEANPPFEKNIIYKMFDKMSKELKVAEKNKKALLFFIIIPKSDTKLSEIPGYIKAKKFLKLERLLEKNDILYMYYDKTFTYAITRPIINTYAIVFHTSYIKEAVKNNVNKIF